MDEAETPRKTPRHRKKGRRKRSAAKTSVIKPQEEERPPVQDVEQQQQQQQQQQRQGGKQHGERKTPAATTATLTPANHRPNGLWHKGTWWCNCEPRIRAIQREVKRETPNRGRFFWRCARQNCHFFLWDDDALHPPQGVSDADGHLPAKTPGLTQRQLTSFGVQVTPRRRQRRRLSVGPGLSAIPDDSADESSGDAAFDERDENTGPVRDQSESTGEAREPRVDMATPSRSPAKRKREAWAAQEEDEFSGLASDDEKLLVDLTDRSVDQFRRHIDALATPNLRHDDAATTTATPVARTLFTTPTTQRSKTVSFSDFPTPTSTLPLPTPSRTPAKPASVAETGNRQDQLQHSSSDGSVDVTDEVLALLRAQRVNSATVDSVKRMLLTSARRARGMQLGRDRARSAVARRDERIAALQERVAALEDRETYLNGQLTHVKAELMRIYEDT